MSEYIVTILDRKKRRERQKQTLVLPSKRSDDLGRRRNTGRINFYDLGMVSTGSGATDWTMLNFTPSAPSFDENPNAFSTTQHQELLNKLFEQPVSTWRSYYKKILPDMNYQITVEGYDVSSGAVTGAVELLTSANPNFTVNGLKAPDSWFDPNIAPTFGQSGVVDYKAFPLWTAGAGNPVLSGNKVTNVYDITAPAVDFTPSRNMDIFMVPSMPRVFGRLAYEDAFGTYCQQLNNTYWIYDRNIMLTSSHPFYRYGTSYMPSGSLFDNLYTANPGSQAVLNACYDFANYFKTLPNARGRYGTGHLDGPFTTTDDGSAFANVTDGTYQFAIGLEPKYWIFEATIAEKSSTLTTGYSIQRVNNQMLLYGVVRQAGTYYYFWNANYA